jgi:predicted Fe-Mo cluster-binding NifX family protein
MKIAISSSGADQNAQVDPRFGRCPYFVIIDTESGKTEAIANAAQSAGGGAGIQAAQTVADQGAETVLTGNVGPNAHRALQAAQITVITGVSGSVSDALKAFGEGQYKATDSPSVQSHFGMSGPRKG